jgi:4-hydroxy-tetrahydrodipicolinate synthase
MAKHCRPEELEGVWSATPTPFTDRMAIDTVSVRRMVEHQIRLEIRGLFVAGSNGEGPWLTEGQKRRLLQTVVKAVRGRIPVAVQVTDNSAARILDNARAARDDGADLAVIAPPYFLLRETPSRILDVYLEAIRNCPLPVGIYDLGRTAAVFVPDGVLRRIYREQNVVLIKDSSTDEARRDIALSARRKRPRLRLLSGYEFDCVSYLEAGYDGLLLGGGVFNGYLANQILEAVAGGDHARAEQLQKRMNRIMYAVYGGKQITCWLSGEKKLLVEMGVFRTWRNMLGYPLTARCRKAISRVLERDLEVLMPWKRSGACPRK